MWIVSIMAMSASKNAPIFLAVEADYAWFGFDCFS